MIYVLIGGAALAVVLVWALLHRRPSMVRSTEDFRETLEKISPEGGVTVHDRRIDEEPAEPAEHERE